MSRGLGKVEQEMPHEIENKPLERTVAVSVEMDASRAKTRLGLYEALITKAWPSCVRQGRM